MCLISQDSLNLGILWGPKPFGNIYLQVPPPSMNHKQWTNISEKHDGLFMGIKYFYVDRQVLFNVPNYDTVLWLDSGLSWI